MNDVQFRLLGELHRKIEISPTLQSSWVYYFNGTGFVNEKDIIFLWTLAR